MNLTHNFQPNKHHQTPPLPPHQLIIIRFWHPIPHYKLLISYFFFIIHLHEIFYFDIPFPITSYLSTFYYEPLYESQLTTKFYPWED